MLGLLLNLWLAWSINRIQIEIPKPSANILDLPAVVIPQWIIDREQWREEFQYDRSKDFDCPNMMYDYRCEMRSVGKI